MSILESRAFQDNSIREKCLSYVKNFTIGQFVPFNLLQHPGTRETLSLAGNGRDDCTLPFKALNPKKIKHHVVEIYHALKQAIQKILNDHVISRCVPSLSLSVDKVKAKATDEDYLGSRISVIDNDGIHRSFNLSIKKYSPSSSLSDVQASELLKTWLKYSLAEFNLTLEDHVGNNIIFCVNYLSFLSILFYCLFNV